MHLSRGTRLAENGERLTVVGCKNDTVYLSDGTVIQPRTAADFIRALRDGTICILDGKRRRSCTEEELGNEVL